MSFHVSSRRSLLAFLEMTLFHVSSKRHLSVLPETKLFRALSRRRLKALLETTSFHTKGTTPFHWRGHHSYPTCNTTPFHHKTMPVQELWKGVCKTVHDVVFLNSNPDLTCNPTRISPKWTHTFRKSVVKAQAQAQKIKAQASTLLDSVSDLNLKPKSFSTSDPEPHQVADPVLQPDPNSDHHQQAQPRGAPSYESSNLVLSDLVWFA